MWRLEDPQGNETFKVKWDIVHYTMGQGLDIGCGPYKGFPHWIGVDNMHHAEEFGWQFKPDVVSAADHLVFKDKSVDFVYSSHTLEHVENPLETLEEWWRVIKPRGYLILYLPHADLYPRCGEPGANPDHKSDFTPKTIRNLMKRVSDSWDLLVNEVRDYDHGPGSELNEYSFLMVFQKTETGKHYHSYQKEPPKEKRACVVRYGGFGDMLQAASVLPELKKQGYHVTFMTTPKGHDILKTNPNIDKFMIQDKDQVKNEDLILFWRSRAKYFDKFINLSESVEGTWLAIAGRTAHEWPKRIRDKYLNVNYLEFTHDLADVPHKFHKGFYVTGEELAWAENQRVEIEAIRKSHDNIVITWALSGSSLHKICPWTDNVVARLMITHPEVVVVFVGDEVAQVLEGQSWDNEPRVWCRSGRWSIRETLAFACRVSDIVVGPETGILNAVAFHDIPKVIALSHSSHENLTKHWKNVTPLTSKARCHPCHKMQYGRGDCPWVKIGDATMPGATEEEVVTAPACTYDISIDDYYNAIVSWITEIKKWRQADPLITTSQQTT